MTLLSSALPALHPAQAVTPPPNTPVDNHVLNLSGLATGQYRATTIPDAGKTYTFHGAGQISPLGRTDVTGTVHLPGLIVPPPTTSATPPTVEAHGQLFLSDVRGTVTLTLEAPSHNNADRLPPYFTYKITNASGAFRGDTGTGIVVIVADPNPTPTPTTTTTPTSGLTETGTFTMVFIPNPPPTAGTGTSSS
jgi:hypothetical protein